VPAGLETEGLKVETVRHCFFCAFLNHSMSADKRRKPVLSRPRGLTEMLRS
jgi:hypothetical protein